MQSAILTRLLLLGVAITLILLGMFFCVDAFLPKEKAVSTSVPILEFLIGSAVVLGGIFIRASSTRRGRVKKEDEKGARTLERRLNVIFQKGRPTPNGVEGVFAWQWQRFGNFHRKQVTTQRLGSLVRLISTHLIFKQPRRPALRAGRLGPAFESHN